MEKGDKQRISEILVKYCMPTRQIAINEIVKELDKAREEGRKYALKEVEYTLAKDERYEFLFTEIKDILSKLTTK